jgi:hypothetical protein
MRPFRITSLKKCENSEKNVLDNFFSNEIVDDASNPNKNILFTNVENIEPYDISYENFSISNNNKIIK